MWIKINLPLFFVEFEIFKKDHAADTYPNLIVIKLINIAEGCTVMINHSPETIKKTDFDKIYKLKKA